MRARARARPQRMQRARRVRASLRSRYVRATHSNLTTPLFSSAEPEVGNFPVLSLKVRIGRKKCEKVLEVSEKVRIFAPNSNTQQQNETGTVRHYRHLQANRRPHGDKPTNEPG